MPEKGEAMADSIENLAEVLESEKRLSQSLVWQLQEDFYLSQGIETWKKRPVFVTGTSSFCELYADLVLALLLDCLDTLKVDQPLYVVELGTGPGAFSCRFLNGLYDRLSHFKALKALDIRYVMTDFVDEIIPLWKANQRLCPFIEKGQLDFAVFRPERQERLDLQLSGKQLPDSNATNPIIFIANAFFDTIRQDAFRISGGDLSETRFTWLRGKELAGQPLSLDQLEAVETYASTDFDYYDDARLNKVLMAYRDRFHSASILFPIGAFNSIANLRRLSLDKFFLLSATKGFSDERFVEGHFRQLYKDLSYGMNFDAVAKYFRVANGSTLLDHRSSPGYRIMINWMLDEPSALEHTNHRFEQILEKNDAIGSRLQLESFLAQTSINLPPGKAAGFLLSMLHLFDYDPDIFSLLTYRLYDLLEKELEGSPPPEQLDLIRALVRVEEKIYSLENLESFEPSCDPLQTLFDVWKRVQTAQAVQPGRWLAPATSTG